MNIALYTDSDVFAGTERHMLDLAVGLRGEGTSPVIACPMKGILAQRALAEGVPVVGVEKGGLVDLRAMRTLATGWRQKRFDVIHAHNGRTALIAALARTVSSRGVVVATQHFLQPARLQRKGLSGLISRSLHRWMSARLDRSVAISQAVRETMLTRGDGAAAKIRVVPNGICDPAPRVTATRASVREQWGVAPGAPLIVSVARLETEKNVQDLVQAMELVLREQPSARCVIAGEGSRRAFLEQQIAQAGLGFSICLAGFLADPLPLIRAADVFVLPSAAEPFGLVLVEAMALGVPVVATCAGGPREIVAHEETGLLIPPNDVVGLGRALLRCIQNPAWAADLGSAGRARYLQHFTVAQMAARMLAVYRECPDGASRRVVLSDKTRHRVQPVCR
jgi:glycosyltransferase involved in cell wall biosynthesis